MRALVTGADGHLGGSLVRALSAQGWAVTGTVHSLDQAEGDAANNSLPRLDIIELDILDADRFRFLCAEVDVLFHLASEHACDQGMSTAEADMASDSLNGVEAAIRAAARQVVRMVLTSSTVAVPLRRPSQPPATEADWQTDMSVPCFRSVTEAERRAWELAEKYALDLVTVLPGAICGPDFPRLTASTAVIESIMLGSLRFGAPRMNFPLVDVRDVVRGHILAAQKPVAGRFLLCGDSFPSLSEIARLMHEIDPSVPRAPVTIPDVIGPLLPYLDWLNSRWRGSERSLTPELVEAMLGRRFDASNERTRAELGWTPKVPIRQTLADTMASLRELRRSAEAETGMAS